MDYHNLLFDHICYFQAKCAGIELTLICSHLESTKQHATERIKQLKIAFDNMKKAPASSTVIFGGDCNLRDPEVRFFFQITSLIKCLPYKSPYEQMLCEPATTLGFKAQ